MIRLVALSELETPLAPGTVGLSVKSGPGCPYEPGTAFVCGARVIDNDKARCDKVSKRYGAYRTFRFLSYDNNAFRIEARTIARVTKSQIRVDDFLAIFRKDCGCEAIPFQAQEVVVACDGTRVNRLSNNHRFELQPDPSGVFVVSADWNRPITHEALVPKQQVLLYDARLRTSTLCFVSQSRRKSELLLVAGSNVITVPDEEISNRYWVFNAE